VCWPIDLIVRATIRVLGPRLPPAAILRDDGHGMDHPNITAYRRTADAFRVGDRGALAALIDEDVVWHIPGSGPMAGDIHGREALFRFFDRVRDVTEGTFMIKEHDVLGSEEHVVALSNWSAAVREGIPVSVNVVGVFHFRDGRQQERWNHASDMAALDRLLGGPT
jgi:ketosteroid isomerase-like protein